ncbi:histidine phosphatase family protein [Pseudomonas putida]|uniref:histidine phosphatase family protein n=1 Tax=Pseudomonas putida TaxID=303 RepID=UPI001ADC2842|nr:histidine phosphatase family protein [Pseudomonas putida]
MDLTGFAALYHSPLHRTVETAQIVNQTAHLPMVADDRLLEISYGDWDGQLNADLMTKYPDLFDPLINDVRAAYAPVANGESFASVEARVQAFTEEVAKAHPDERVADLRGWIPHFHDVLIVHCMPVIKNISCNSIKYIKYIHLLCKPQKLK